MKMPKSKKHKFCDWMLWFGNINNNNKGGKRKYKNKKLISIKKN